MHVDICISHFMYITMHIGETQDKWDAGEVGHPHFLKILMANHNLVNYYFEASRYLF